MGIVAWIILGGIAGWIASMIAGNNEEQGLLGNIVVGMLGALVGGFVVSLMGGKGVTGFNLWSLLVAVAGSLLLLLVLGRFKRS
ncbi:MAG TPA: GlsB/YeaQ/YmgE family stress response membrane protein [Candidatus Saccharimonadales bacterium]|nr:GlsB/YeaQ/YmgE family stress response membrane protein [Candidatus Saccharimonadales bacterium]